MDTISFDQYKNDPRLLSMASKAGCSPEEAFTRICKNAGIKTTHRTHRKKSGETNFIGTNPNLVPIKFSAREAPYGAGFIRVTIDIDPDTAYRLAKSWAGKMYADPAKQTWCAVNELARQTELSPEDHLAIAEYIRNHPRKD